MHGKYQLLKRRIKAANIDIVDEYTTDQNRFNQLTYVTRLQYQYTVRKVGYVAESFGADTHSRYCSMLKALMLLRQRVPIKELAKIKDVSYKLPSCKGGIH